MLPPVAACGLAGLLLLAVLAGCSADPSGVAPPPPPPPEQPATRFVAIGDAGTGDAEQAKVAGAMAAVCATRGCDFAVGLGDNIYPAGAGSASDPQFDSKFETPYANLSLPFWMVLGNHDNSQDPAETGATAGLGLWYQAGDNEVAYGARADRASDKWHMPARHYTFTSGPAAFLALDTNTLLFDDVAMPPQQLQQVQAQAAWVDGAIGGMGKATWRFALGHHGYLSNGPHGNAGSYDGRPGVPGQSGDYVKSFFEQHVCGKVDVYLFGHDHDLQWLDAVPSCGATQFIGSGGGGADTYPLRGSDKARFQDDVHGFWWVSVQGGTLTAAAYDDAGALQYEGTLTKAA